MGLRVGMGGGLGPFRASAGHTFFKGSRRRQGAASQGLAYGLTLAVVLCFKGLYWLGYWFIVGIWLFYKWLAIYAYRGARRCGLRFRTWWLSRHAPV